MYTECGSKGCQERFVMMIQTRPDLRVVDADREGLTNDLLHFEIIDRGLGFVVGGKSADIVLARFGQQSEAQQLLEVLAALEETRAIHSLC